MKATLRSTFTAYLQDIQQQHDPASPLDLPALSHQATQYLLSMPQYLLSSTVALFLPIPGELDTLPLLHAAFAASKRVFLPRVTGPGSGDMTMLEVHGMEEVAAMAPEGKYGLRQPSLEYTDSAGAQQARLDWRACPPCLILTPGLGFDHFGGRLGRGKGYYDTWLAAVQAQAREREGGGEGRKNQPPTPFLVALALEGQVLPPPQTIPLDPWDVPIHAICTPEGVVMVEEWVVGGKKQGQ